MKSDAITVELRLSAKAESKVKAFADITIPLGDDGTHNPGFLSTRWRRAPPEAYESCAKGQAGLVRHSTAERKNSVVCRRGSTRRVRAKNESLEVVGVASQGIEGSSGRGANQCGQRAAHSLDPRRDEHVLNCSGCS